jgi:hypothetical protein
MPGHHRPVHRFWREEVAPAIGSRHVASSWIRWARSRALVWPNRAIPPALRRPPGSIPFGGDGCSSAPGLQHAGRLSDVSVLLFQAIYREELFDRTVTHVLRLFSTPANYFHVLRRQVHRDFRKPVRHHLFSRLSVARTGFH